MNYNKYQQTEKDFVRYCNMIDITAENEISDDYDEDFVDNFMIAHDDDYYCGLPLIGMGFYVSSYNRGLRSCKCFGMIMKRRDSKVCLNVIRRLGLVNFCSIYRNYDVIWEPQKDMNRKQEIRRTLHELAKKIIGMSESNPYRLQMYSSRYHLSYNNKMAKKISKLNDPEAKEASFFHLKLQIISGIISGMREELIRSGYWEE